MHLPKNEGNFENAPPGTFLAVCYRVIDLGTQDTTFAGKPKRKHKIMISWELPDEKMKDGRPFMVSQRYTWSTSPKSGLRRDLESWRGVPFAESDFGPGGFDIKNILGKPCLLTIVHTEDGQYANIKSVSRIMKGMTPPEKPTNPMVFLALTPEEWDPKVFYSLSDGLQATIKASPEYAALSSGALLNDEPPPHDAQDFHDDPIPF